MFLQCPVLFAGQPGRQCGVPGTRAAQCATELHLYVVALCCVFLFVFLQCPMLFAGQPGRQCGVPGTRAAQCATELHVGAGLRRQGCRIHSRPRHVVGILSGAVSLPY